VPSLTPDSGASVGDIVEFVGVYDADATLWGEVSYWVGARLGRRHCSLCDVTHGMFRRKRAWDACTAAIPVPFAAYHRNDAPDDVRTHAAGTYPIVVARTSGGLVTAAGPADLDACHGDAEALATLLTEFTGFTGLTDPA
jgi:hypothetical protein